MKVIIVICWFLALGGNALAQLSELRHSRAPLPGVSEISLIGLNVDMGGAQDLMAPAVIIEAIQPRLETIGYRVALGPTLSPDGLWLLVDCQAIKEKAKASSSEASQALSNHVRILSPPCQLAYRYQQEVVPWKNVDRLIYSESVATMTQLARTTKPLEPQECAKEFFHLYDFPVLLAAEWGHVDRLLHLLKRPDTSVVRQRLILKLLGEAQVARGYPVLVNKLEDGLVAKEAAEALGFFGLRAQVHLLRIVQDSSDPQLQAAAAKGLGTIAAATGNSQQTPLFMKMVADPSIDIRVRTQLVWALGKAPDMRAYSTLLQLEQRIWNNYSRDPDLKEFREAVDWSIREVKQGGHGDDF